MRKHDWRKTKDIVFWISISVAVGLIVKYYMQRDARDIIIANVFALIAYIETKIR